MDLKSFTSSFAVIILAVLLAMTTAYFFTHFKQEKQVTNDYPLSDHTKLHSLLNDKSSWNAWALVDSTAQGAAWLRYIGTKESDPLIRINHGEPVILKQLLPLHLTLQADLHYSREWIKRNFIPGKEMFQQHTSNRTYEAVLARTHYIDNVLIHALNSTISESNISDFSQLVILGAGYDTRAFRFHPFLGAKQVKVFEIDLPKLQEKKVSLLKEGVVNNVVLKTEGDLKSAFNNIAFIPIDFENNTITNGEKGMNDMWSKMKEQGYDETKKSLFIWEGVTAYLTPTAVASTLHSIHHHSSPTSILVFDFLALASKCYNSSIFQDIAAVAQSLNEPFKFLVKIPPIRGEDEEEKVVETEKRNPTTNESTEEKKVEEDKSRYTSFTESTTNVNNLTKSSDDELSVSEQTDANEEEQKYSHIRKEAELSSPQSKNKKENQPATKSSSGREDSGKAKEILPLPLEVPRSSSSNVLPDITPFPSPVEEAWHLRELTRYLSSLGWHLTDLKDPARLERQYLVDSEGNFIGIVACFEHLATATNKQFELEAEIPRVKNKITW